MRSVLVFCLLAFAAFIRSQDAPGAPGIRKKLDPKLEAVLKDAQQLIAGHHSADALAKLDEAAAINPDEPIVWNMRGSVYTSDPLRDFAKARECFAKVEAMRPGTFEPAFNLAEVDYVSGGYTKAEQSFGNIIAKFPKLPENVRHLVLFKIIVCQLKQDKVPAAEAGGKAFTFMDDTPAYYFAKAAVEYHKKNEAAANDWVQKAVRIFKAQPCAPYIDTMMEAKWIQRVGTPSDAAAQ